MAKISWSKALADYLKDETQSYASIAEKYGVSVQAVKKRASKEGWQDLRQKTIQKVDQKLPDKLGESIAEVTARHAQVGKTLQAEGIQAIKGGMKPQSFKDARLSILSGIEIERKALDLEKGIFTWDDPKRIGYRTTLTAGYLGSRIGKR